MVFLNGCPLRCRWCSNPESQTSQPPLALNLNKCIGTRECGRCIEDCHAGAITASQDGKIRINRPSCYLCFTCTSACPCEALRSLGSLRSLDEVIKAVEQDSLFYGRSGGGMTLSGGEPLMQSDFALALLREARRRKLDTAIETCGYVEWEVLKNAADFCDTVFFDVKCMDEAKHEEFTGVSNDLILANLRKLAAEYPRLSIIARTPLIPGFNDSIDEISSILEFVRELPGVSYQVLPYHRLGTPKYEYLDRRHPLGDAVLDSKTEKTIQEFVKQSVVVKGN